MPLCPSVTANYHPLHGCCPLNVQLVTRQIDFNISCLPQKIFVHTIKLKDTKNMSKIRGQLQKDFIHVHGPEGHSKMP